MDEIDTAQPRRTPYDAAWRDLTNILDAWMARHDLSLVERLTLLERAQRNIEQNATADRSEDAA